MIYLLWNMSYVSKTNAIMSGQIGSSLLKDDASVVLIFSLQSFFLRRLKY